LRSICAETTAPGSAYFSCMSLNESVGEVRGMRSLLMRCTGAIFADACIGHRGINENRHRVRPPRRHDGFPRVEAARSVSLSTAAPGREWLYGRVAESGRSTALSTWRRRPQFPIPDSRVAGKRFSENRPAGTVMASFGTPALRIFLRRSELYGHDERFPKRRFAQLCRRAGRTRRVRYVERVRRDEYFECDKHALKGTRSEERPAASRAVIQPSDADS
jgi:hypothetical protein